VDLLLFLKQAWLAEVSDQLQGGAAPLGAFFRFIICKLDMGSGGSTLD